MAKSYENLKIWQESLEIAILMYSITKKFPKDEIFGIISQIRRAAISYIFHNLYLLILRKDQEELAKKNFRGLLILQLDR